MIRLTPSGKAIASLTRRGLSPHRAAGGVDDPGPKGAERRFVLAALAPDQIPVLALRHREREGRNEALGLQVVVDIGADANRDTNTVGGGLDRLAVIFELRARGATPQVIDASVYGPSRSGGAKSEASFPG